MILVICEMGKTNEQTKHIDTGNRLVVARGRRRKVAEMGEGSPRYKLSVTKEIRPGDAMLGCDAGM